MDLSQYSDEELEKIAAGEDLQQPSESLLSKLGQGYLNYAGGVFRGAGQALGDVGASAANLGLEKLGMPYRIPHPNLILPNPSLAGSLGQNLGSIGAQLALPLGIAGKVGKALTNAPKLAKVLGSVGSGALEGYLGNEDNREQAAALGAGLSGLGMAIPRALNYAKSFGSKSIAKDITNRMKILQKDYGNKFENLIQNASEEMPNAKLKPTLINRQLFKKGNFDKDLHALDKFNQNPSLENAHKAQSALGQIMSNANKKKGDLYRDISKGAKNAQDNILKQIQINLEKIKDKNYSEEYKNLRAGYGKEVGPYLKSKTISTYLKGDLAPRYVTKGLLNETKTMSKISKYHPKLRQREIMENLLKSGLLDKIAGAGAKGYGLYKLGKLIP